MRNNAIAALLLSGLGTTLSFHSPAFEREHEAHQHGHARLMLVQENDELQLALESPAMNIVGFEHAPHSDEDQELVEKATQQLQNGRSLFRFDPEAKCALEHVRISSELIGQAHAGHHDNEHDENDHHEHGHDKHEKHQEDEEHAHHDDTHDNENDHSEFHASYHFECENIGQLAEIEVALFERFPGMEEVEAHIVNDHGQQVIELTAANPRIRFQNAK